VRENVEHMEVVALGTGSHEQVTTEVVREKDRENENRWILITFPSPLLSTPLLFMTRFMLASLVSSVGYSSDSDINFGL
jgi:hypothetical protein